MSIINNSFAVFPHIRPKKIYFMGGKHDDSRSWRFLGKSIKLYVLSSTKTSSVPAMSYGWFSHENRFCVLSSDIRR